MNTRHGEVDNRFLLTSKHFSFRYGRKNGYPILRHVTLPRLGALQTLLTSLSPRSMLQNGTADRSYLTTGDLTFVFGVCFCTKLS